MPFDGVHATALNAAASSATALSVTALDANEQRTLGQELVRARLRYTRNQIAAGKWCQHKDSDGDGNRCLVAWLFPAPRCEIGLRAVQQIWLALPKSAQRKRDSYFMRCDVARYNDTHTRSMVIKLLDRAIDAA